MAGLFGAGKGAGTADLEVEFGEFGSGVGIDHRFHAGDGIVIAAVGDEPDLAGVSAAADAVADLAELREAEPGQTRTLPQELASTR